MPLPKGLVALSKDCSRLPVSRLELNHRDSLLKGLDRGLTRERA